MARKPKGTIGLIRNGLPQLIITTKYEQSYTCKNQWQSYSKYYNILNSRINHSYANKAKGKKKEEKMKMKSRGKEKIK